MASPVDQYLEGLEKWQAEATLMHEILIDCQLVPTIKWRVPCYTFNDANIILMALFKDYCSLSFIKGVLLKDEQKLLISPGENSQSVKYLRFNSLDEIKKQKSIIKQYIFEAITIEEQGLKVDKEASKNFELAEELLATFKKDKGYEKAFKQLTIGRQRAYNMFFLAAKQSVTRFSRIESSRNRILDGYGMNDCTCGLSKRMPNCDGSHKQLKA